MDASLINDTKMTILETTSSYPRKNDCYKVECTNVVTGKTWINEFMPITEYNLIISLWSLGLSATNSNKSMLIKSIEDNNEYIRQVATDEAEMNHNDNQ